MALWYAGFNDIKGPTDVLGPREATRARRTLGLETRRELSTPEYWQEKFGISRQQLDEALRSMGVARPYDGDRLRRKAMHRLRLELGEHKPSTKPQEQPPLPEQSFDWPVVGRERDLRLLTVEEVKNIHATLVDDFQNSIEPIDPPGIRSENLLASAVMRPETGIGESRKYPTIEMAAAALLHSLVHDHPFHNGNKRTALVAMLVFLDRNGLILTCDEDDLFRLVLQVAQHSITQGPRHELADRETIAIASWLKDHSRWVEKGDRCITRRRLEQILSGYGCMITRSGSNISITRRVHRRMRFFPVFSKSRELRSQTHFAGSSRDISPSALKKLRHDLELDDAHGIDSSAFYDDAKVSTSDFIARYRKTLNRLARL